MAGALNGLGSGQQVPLANTFQPGQQADVRIDDGKRKQNENVVQPRGTAAAQSQNSETGNSGITRGQQSPVFKHQLQNNQDASVTAKRGSIVDITA